MKNQKYLRIILISLLFLIINNCVKAQNDCTTADTLSSNFWSEYQFQDNQYYWIKFTADTLDYFFNIVQPTDTSAANVTDIFLYAGDSCSNLSLITSQSTQQYDSLRIFGDSLTQGATYFICVKQDTTLKNYFRLCVEKLLNKSWASTDCPPPQVCSASSDLISNGAFNPGTVPYPPVDPFVTQSGPAGVICGWQTAWGTPNIATGTSSGYPTLATGEYAAHLWARTYNTEGIYHDFNFGVPQQNEKYSLSFIYATNTTVELNVVLTNDVLTYSPNYYTPHNFSTGIGSDQYLVDDETIYNTNSNWVQKTVCFSNLSDTYNRICIYPRNPYDDNCRGVNIDSVSLIKHSFEITTQDAIFCDPDSVEIITAPCPPVGNDQGIIWNFLWSTGETTQNITPYTQGTTTYTVTATNSCGFSFTDEVTITIIEQLIKPEITGNLNTCDSNATYVITNAQTSYTYFWEIGDNSYSSSFPQYGSSISVVWQPLWGSDADYTWIYITTNDTVSGCKTYDSIRIWKCCRKNAYTPVFNDETITDASVFDPNPAPPYFNGTIVIDDDINVSDIDYILMGPEARFVVNPPYTFTVTNSHILAGCPYMWDGIYITDSNAKVIIEEESIVQDALKSVYSEDGGKFELKNSSFFNNYTSVFARDNFYGVSGPIYSHKGKIYGCLFDAQGTGMIPPYLNDKPRHGVHLENVYNITVGDSTQDSNMFRNIFCGIASFNSSVNVYNNNFYYINNSSSCSSVTGDYYNLQCETAIHCAAIYRDAYHIVSKIVCGAGANSSNIFDTDKSAIYTYNIITGVNYAKVTGTGTGVYAREPILGSYVTNSTFKTNISAGVQFISVLPLYNRITVKYDSILNPTMGVKLMNIRSHPSFLAFKTIVSNNYITNIKNSPVWGLWFEKCDNIEAYCNMIHRASLPPTNYQLFINGITIYHSVSAKIHDNTSENIGVSIRGNGSLLGTQFKCNTSDGSYNGFYFDDFVNVQTILSDQGTLNSPNDNTLYNDVTNYFRIDGTYTGVTVDWYYRNLLSEYLPNKPIYLNNIILTPAVNPIAVNCQNCTYGPLMAGNSNPTINEISGTSPTGINNNEIDAIINESNNYNEFDELFKYFEKQYAYQKLEENQLELTTTLRNYYYSLKNSNIGKFDQIYREIENNNIENAKTLNNQISPVNNIEINRKWVNSVYFDYIVPQKAIPQNIIDELETLASTSPFVNGDAVYSARAIVGYTETETIVNPKSLEQGNTNNDNSNKHDITVNVYPNPAENNIYVELKGKNGDFNRFILRNMLGIKLIEKEIKDDRNKLTINTSKLNNGLYIYEVLNSDGISIKSGRLVISK